MQRAGMCGWCDWSDCVWPWASSVLSCGAAAFTHVSLPHASHVYHHATKASDGVKGKLLIVSWYFQDESVVVIRGDTGVTVYGPISTSMVLLYTSYMCCGHMYHIMRATMPRHQAMVSVWKHYGTLNDNRMWLLSLPCVVV